MRTYGRVYDEFGGYKWVEVDTLPNGNNDRVWLTTLIQCLKLNLGESPFFANYGIPAHPAIIQQIFPDFYVSRTQQQFAPYFASLIITKVPNTEEPTYNVNAVLNDGTKINMDIPV